MDETQCLSVCKAPDLRPGDTRGSGAYWRNLTKKEVVRLCKQDDSLEFGYTYRFDKWYWRPDGLSVSCCTCLCEKCSLVLSRNARAIHVVRIELAGFARLVGTSFEAQYQPETEADACNPCHFLLIPSEQPVEVTEVLLKDLYLRFKGTERTPRTNEERDAAGAMAGGLAEAFTLRRDARHACGTPALP